MFHICLPTETNDDWKVFDIPLETLAVSSYLIHRIIENFGFSALEDAYIRLSNMSEDVVEACLSFLKGKHLYIKLSPSPLSIEFTRKLLEYTQFAYVLNIPRLMRAAMHALCTAFHSSPMDWKYDDAMIMLLNEVTYRGNPARRFLSSMAADPSRVIKAEIGSNDFPSDEEGIRRICFIDSKQWHGLFSGGGKRFPYPVSEEFRKQLALKEQDKSGEDASVEL